MLKSLSFLLLYLVFGSSYAQRSMQRITLEGVKCGDQATDYNFFLSPSVDENHLWVVWLESNGFCWSASTCAGGVYAATQWPDASRFPSHSILSTNASNPFKDANLVYLPDCTYDLFQGQQYGGRHRGRAVIVAAVQRLAQLLASAGSQRHPQQVVYGGSGWASLAALYTARWMRSLFNETSVDLLLLIDGWLALPTPSVGGSSGDGQAFGELVNLAYTSYWQSPPPDPWCVEALDPSADVRTCFYPPLATRHVGRHIRAATARPAVTSLIIASQSDTWQWARLNVNVANGRLVDADDEWRAQAVARGVRSSLAPLSVGDVGDRVAFVAVVCRGHSFAAGAASGVKWHQLAYNQLKLSDFVYAWATEEGERPRVHFIDDSCAYGDEIDGNLSAFGCSSGCNDPVLAFFPPPTATPSSAPSQQPPPPSPPSPPSPSPPPTLPPTLLVWTPTAARHQSSDRVPSSLSLTTILLIVVIGIVLMLLLVSVAVFLQLRRRRRRAGRLALGDAAALRRRCSSSTSLNSRTSHRTSRPTTRSGSRRASAVLAPVYAAAVPAADVFYARVPQQPHHYTPPSAIF